MKKLDTTMPWFGASIQDGLGYKGKAANGILSIGVPRMEDITMQDDSIPPAMGVGVAMNFQGRRLRANWDRGRCRRTSLKTHGFEVTALHHHMIAENPTLYYMHFWAVQAPSAIAAGLKDALSHVKVKRP
ncbi:MAG: hypothetical protein NVSMB6_21350 [Burkholderiaceae bacterium]